MKHSKRLKMKEDRVGAIGIGTLIVFIAMVLVAVIAAAVIIKTASELEQSAEEYGDKAGKDVGLGIKVQQFEGQANAGGDEIEDLRIYVSLYGGSESLDMRYLLLHMWGWDNDPAGGGFSVDYAHPSAVGAGPNTETYTVTEINDPLDSYPNILDQQSTLRIDIDITAATTPWTNNGLSQLSEISLQFMMSNGGAVTTESANTPGSYGAGEWMAMV
jgi:archaellin